MHAGAELAEDGIYRSMTDGIETVKLTREYIKKFLPIREINSHKGTYGTVLNIAGSLQFPGAAYLSSISALKVGCGLVTLGTATCVIPIVASLAPEITYLNLGESDYFSIPKDGNKYIQLKPDAISIGCGLGLSGGTKDFVLNFLSKHENDETPIIIDADGINTISSSLIKKFPLNSVITPHPTELSRLIKVPVEEIQANRVMYAWETAKQFECMVVLKGYETVIAVPNGKIFINTTGNSSLSKGGTGDILTGMIAGFSAQGLKLEDAVSLAVYLHGLAGEIAGQAYSPRCTLATNIINSISPAIKEIEN